MQRLAGGIMFLFLFLAVISGIFFGCATTTSTPTTSTTSTTAGGGTHDLTELFFLHHSVGDDLIAEGDVRGHISTYNSAHGTSFKFWDHGYNYDGLRDPAGNMTGIDFAVPEDNTDPDGFYNLWTSSASDWTATRNQIMASFEVIAFKSCYPASGITDAAALQQYKDWYLAMRDYFDAHPEKVFVVMSTPPMHRLAAVAAEAANARAFANWLKSSAYLSGHSNVVCFDLFDYLAKADDSSATANMLKYEYERSHFDDDSHPNDLADQTIGPIFAQFLINSSLNY